MADSNNVINFPNRKVLKQAEPAVDEIARFRHTYEETADTVQLFVDDMIYELADIFGASAGAINPNDYALVMESVISLFMRTQGVEHPLCHPIADELFTDRPTK